jgi:DNA-binding NtrC family response regulator
METDRVLLVDDEVEFVEALAERFQSRGLAVEIATSGKEAIEKVKNETFHAVILDFAMPGMDGIETLKILLDLGKNVQVMLLTGQATIKAAVEATRLGAVDVLEKPTDITTLIEKIREARVRFIAERDKQTRERTDEIVGKYGW